MHNFSKEELDYWMEKIMDFYVDSLVDPELHALEEKLNDLEGDLTQSQLPSDIQKLLQLNFFNIRVAILVAKHNIRNHPDPIFSPFRGK